MENILETEIMQQVAHAIDKIEDGIKSDECISQDVTNLVDKLNK